MVLKSGYDTHAAVLPVPGTIKHVLCAMHCCWGINICSVVYWYYSITLLVLLIQQYSTPAAFVSPTAIPMLSYMPMMSSSFLFNTRFSSNHKYKTTKGRAVTRELADCCLINSPTSQIVGYVGIAGPSAVVHIIYRSGTSC